jgi:Arc/MetJ family transcription regulator
MLLGWERSNDMPEVSISMHTEPMIRRTSLNLDIELVDQAKAALGTKETTETIHRALADAVRHARLRRLVKRRFELTAEEERELQEWTLGGGVESVDGAR